MTEPTSSSSANAPMPPAPDSILVLDAGAIDRVMRRIAHEIIERNPDLSTAALVGIPTRGVAMAGRLAKLIQEYSGVEVFAGAVDVAMHRDDLHRRKKLTPVQPTLLPEDLDHLTIILVDDVLFSGRTIRAAMDAISSFGRPAKIQLAVLLDRGHRELPIRADYVGKNLPTSPAQRVFVRFPECDDVPEEAVYISERA